MNAIALTTFFRRVHPSCGSAQIKKEPSWKSNDAMHIVNHNIIEFNY